MADRGGYDEILYDVDDPVATITLNRPDKLNAWTPTITAEFRDAIGRAERDRRVVGIVVTGAGRGFCAGADLGRLDSVAAGVPAAVPGDTSAWEGGPAATPGDAGWGSDFRGTYTFLMSVPKPVVAAINGPIAGMAVSIALCCDLRLISDDAVLTTSFAERALVAEWGTSWLLPRLVGPAVALDLLLSARRIDGREAARIGFASEALPTDQVLARAQDYVRDLALRCSPASLATIKRQVYQQLHQGLGAAEGEAVALMRATFATADFRDAVAAFKQRRRPEFARIGD